MQNKLVWLHLSDIHFHPKTSWRDVASRQALLDFLKEEFAKGSFPRPDIVFCTGDIAFGETSNAPLTQQYAHAKAFFNELLQCCGLKKDRLFVVPGNHDINRQVINQDAQESLTGKTEHSRQHEDTINQRFTDNSQEHQAAMSRLKEYGEFIASYLPHQLDANHCYRQVVEIDGLQIGIAGFNSAWSCAGPEDDRRLWLAAKAQFSLAKQDLHGTQLRIGLIHHPIDWLNEAERETAQARRGNFHFWLHGHSHHAWVNPGQGLIEIAAGATGAAQAEEFGCNLVQLDFSSNQGQAHLFTYSPRSDGWMIHAIPQQAPMGRWDFQVPAFDATTAPAEPVHMDNPAATPAPNSDSASVSVAPHNTVQLYGRSTQLAGLQEVLQRKHVVLLYGLRGNGKSSLIDALLLQAPLHGLQVLRFNAGLITQPEQLLLQLAAVLGEHNDSLPTLPEASALVAWLQQRYPNVPHLCIRVDSAQRWLDGTGWRQPQLAVLLRALMQAFAGKWYWLLEMAEQPPPQLGLDCHREEVPGLDKASLKEWLSAAAPAGADWTYGGDQLKGLYQWLGGGNGQQAHPLAVRLLLEVAQGQHSSPWAVRQTLLNDSKHTLEEKLEAQLLRSLFHEVLTNDERQLLCALALYRDGIPHDHIDGLSEALRAPQGWAGLQRRCLLPSDPRQEWFYLHGFIAEWLRQQLGCPLDAEQISSRDWVQGCSTAQLDEHDRLQQVIAAQWLQQLQGRRITTQVNLSRAQEAFHHLLCAGQAERLGEIALDLIGQQREWAVQRLWAYDDALRAQQRPVTHRRMLLDYITRLDPDQHKAWRFLGECWQKAEGRASRKAEEAFEKALTLHPDFPPYLNNLGKCLLAQRRAENALHRLAAHSHQFPKALDDYGRAIQADCLRQLGRNDEASKLRQQWIKEGRHHPAFYAEEAEYQLSLGQPEAALYWLDLAIQHRVDDDYTRAIRSKALAQAGQPEQASQLRQQWIKEGKHDAAFYAEEAEYQLSLGQPEAALYWLDLAVQHRVDNDYTRAIRSKALAQAGQPEQASQLRQQWIKEGGRNPVFYNDEAEYQLSLGQPEAALHWLDLAVQHRVDDDYTRNIRAKIMRQRSA